MVSHDIKEVVYMADRIVVLDANPGRVRTVVENTLPRPRDYRAPGLLHLVDRLHDIITGMEMPDVPAAPRRGVRAAPRGRRRARSSASSSTSTRAAARRTSSGSPRTPTASSAGSSPS